MSTSRVVEQMFELMSALQKAIRWCEVNDARYFAKELIEMGTPGTNFTRLKVIAAEDVGLADPTLFKYIWGCSDKFETLLKDYGAKKSMLSGFPEICEVIDQAVIAAALSYKSRLLPMLSFAILFEIYKKEDFNHDLNEYRNLLRAAIRDRDEKQAAYYAYVLGIFLKRKTSLLEIVQQESEARNTELIGEWVREYRRTRKEDKFLVLAGIISLLCRDLPFSHGEYRDHVSEWVDLPIEEAIIPERAYDMHTGVGRREGCGLEHFFNEPASVRNERFQNDLEELGKESYFQAEKEGFDDDTEKLTEAIKERCDDYAGQVVLEF